VPFDLPRATVLLARTPSVLHALLLGLPDELLHADEGDASWSPYQVLGHLIHGERTDWIPRAKRILAEGEAVPFLPFDRFAQLAQGSARPVAALLDEFTGLRDDNLRTLHMLDLQPADYDRRGTHPALGRVTLGQLLSTWIVHDLDHLAQIARVLAHQDRHEVGPWAEFLPILAARAGRA
jgi:uncharacterized damage-inducible protein DinB